jgi:hypothetical protein
MPARVLASFNFFSTYLRGTDNVNYVRQDSQSLLLLFIADK